jgi:histone acetyltransferase (RNA polymerase elongator complex component)
VRVYPFFIPHAGCPHRCLFCAQDRSTGHSVVPGTDEITATLEEILPEAGDGEVAFYGGTFSLLPVEQQDEYLAAARRYVRSGRVAGIRISTRPDALDDRNISRLQASGVTTIEIGCQSFDDNVLMSAGRGHAAEDNRSAIKDCLDAGLQVGVQLMPGLPGGGAEEALLSLTEALQSKPTFLRIYPTVVLDGTALADSWRAGSFQPWSLEKAVDVCADMLHYCRRADVPVIRFGLQSDPHLEENLLAGPYHPAFGQLVRSRLWRRALHKASKHDERFAVNPADLSDVLGHRGENRDWLKERAPGMAITVDPNVKRFFLRSSGRDLRLLDLFARGGHSG